MSEKTRIVISSSHHRDYCFPLPITGLLWREVVGFEPIFLLTRDEGFWRSQEKRCGTALDALKSFGFAVEFCGQIEGYEDARLGQNAREHASVFDLPSDLWLMMSDADLWPLARDWYHQHEGSRKIAACYYANGDNFVSKEDVLSRHDRGERFQTLPTCHVTMRVSTWRSLYGLTPGEPIAMATKRTMDAWFAHLRSVNRGFELWMCDQDIVTEKLCHQEWFPRDALMIPRTGWPPEDRIDRCSWPARACIQGITDSHILKSPDQPGNWEKLREIVEQAIPDHVYALDAYRNEFLKGY